MNNIYWTNIIAAKAVSKKLTCGLFAGTRRKSPIILCLKRPPCTISYDVNEGFTPTTLEALTWLKLSRNVKSARYKIKSLIQLRYKVGVSMVFQSLLCSPMLHILQKSF